jgi:ubiquinone/menaquinone biosynthesis C-methylase UbiE
VFDPGHDIFHVKGQNDQVIVDVPDLIGPSGASGPETQQRRAYINSSDLLTLTLIAIFKILTGDFHKQAIQMIQPSNTEAFTIGHGDVFREVDTAIYSSLDTMAGTPYDSKAKLYEKLVGSKWYNRIVWGASPEDYRQFARNAISGPGGPLIDIGCGGLVQTASLYRSTNRISVLTDSSIAMLKIARTRLSDNHRQIPSNIKLLLADAFALPFADNSFDTVCSFGMIHLFDKKQEFVDEALRVLKTGGDFYFSSMTTEKKIGTWYMKQLRKYGEFGEPFSAQQIISLFNNKHEIQYRVKGSMLFISGKKK